MMFDGSGSWGWGDWLAMAVMMVAAFALVVAVVVVLMRAQQPASPAAPEVLSPFDRAVRVLDERFARGEIDVEEYSRRRETLRSASSQSGTGPVHSSAIAPTARSSRDRSTATCA